jgi:tRNA nucleotidyltransferase (CCA-adding enzyme)
MEIIVTHVSADFDAFAGMAAASKIYPRAKLVLPTAVNSNVRKFISLYEDELPPVQEPSEIDFDSVKKVIMVDTRIPSRTGPAEAAIRDPSTEVVVYDHHLKTEKDIRADRDYSRETGAAATILIEKIREEKIGISPLEATFFLAGIYEDTGSFGFPGTTSADLDAAAYLMKKDANLFVVLKFLNLSLTSVQHQLLEKLIMNSRKFRVNETEVMISSAVMPEYVEGLSVLTRKLSQIEEVSIIFCWVKMKEKTYAVARSDNAEADVSKILAAVGGGGHPQAASAVIDDLDFGGIEERIRKSLKKNIRKPLLASDIMSYPVRTIPQDASISQVDGILRTFGHTGIPIVDQEGALAGIITRKDVDRAIKHGLSHAPVKGFRSHSTIKAGPGSSIDHIQDLMINNGIGRVPIVRKKKIIGIITRKDILRYLHGRSYGPSMEFFPARIRDLFRIISAVSRSMKVNTYLVGGMVRDALLRIPNYDIDIVVDGDGIELGRRLACRLDARLQTHKKFMTAVLVLKNGQHIDIATSRVEYYHEPAQLPSVESGSIKQDLARRDFTINTLALSLNRKNFGEILDFFGGSQDLKNRRIKVLHKMSFVEDPTRIFRAVRFENRLGFRMDKHTEALARNAVEMDIVSRLTGVRIRDELIYILDEEKPLKAVRRLYGLGALSKIGIDISMDRKNTSAMQKALDSLERLKAFGGGEMMEWRLLLAMMLGKKNGRSIESWCLRMKIRKQDMTVIKNTVWGLSDTRRQLGKPVKDKTLYKKAGKYPGELLAICHSRGGQYAKNIEKYYTRLAKTSLDIGGEDLKNMGYRPSPAFKKTLDRVFFMKMEGRVQGREEQLKAASRMIKSYDRKLSQTRSSAR